MFGDKLFESDEEGCLDRDTAADLGQTREESVERVQVAHSWRNEKTYLLIVLPIMTPHRM